jgi:iron complex outermembrane receptor protein
MMRTKPQTSHASTSNLFIALPLAAAIIGTAQPHASVLEEVIVTAQKREQSLQDVGVSVTAFTGKQLEQLGLDDAIDLVAQTPGLEVSGAGGGTINSFSVRGVTQNDFAASQESPVAVYIDEGYISLNSITNFSLFDIERVEVLRGPQGTLFGRNATGGLVHYITARPTQEAEGYVDFEIGEEGRQRIEAAISGGLSDTVSGRLSGVYNKSDGLIDNDIGPDLMATDDYSVRGQLLIDVSDDLSVLLKAQYADEDSVRGGYAHTVAAAGEFVADPTATDFFGYRDADNNPYTASNDFAGYTRAEVSEFMVNVEWTLGDYTLTSITDYQDVEDAYGEDADASPADVYNYEQRNTVKQFSQEIRVNWEGETSKTVVGFYYLNIDGEYQTRQTGDAFFGSGVGYPVGTAEVAQGQQDTTTYALFAQTEIDLSETVALTLGGRYNKDDKDFTYRSTDIYFLQGGDFSFRDSLTEDDWSAKVQIDYRPNGDWLLYAGVNRGIKAGGFNLPLFPIAEGDFEFTGEVLTTYEAGFKATLSESTRLNVSAYYYDYEDYQAYSFDGFATFLFNAEAETTGAEIELITTPVKGLDILLGAAWMDAEVTDVPRSISPTGKETAALAPDLSVNGLIRYSWQALGGSVAVQLDGNWKDDHNFNLSYSPVIEEDAYAVFNAKLSYISEDETWSGSLFVKNLEDKRYRSYAFDSTSFFNSVEDVPGVERWIGANIKYRW